MPEPTRGLGSRDARIEHQRCAGVAATRQPLISAYAVVLDMRRQDLNEIRGIGTLRTSSAERCFSPRASRASPSSVQS